MNSESAAIQKIAAMSVEQRDTDILNNALTCSCIKCDSFQCFALRNKDDCCREKCSAEVCDSKSIDASYPSNKTFQIDVPYSENSYKERIKKEIIYDDDSIINFTSLHQDSYSCATDESTTALFDSISKTNSSSEVPYTPNAKVSLSRKYLDSTTAKLSAQIMNVPYPDFKEISNNKSRLTDISTKLTKYDILKRIKEAYKACSCKVCECIIGKTVNEYCKCEPCGCKECIAVTNKLKFDETFIQPYTGCPCIRCNRSKCKGITKNLLFGSQHCDCNSLHDSYNNINDYSCDCKPCECIECKSYFMARPKTIIINQMLDDVPRSFCTCSPCECEHCVQRLPIPTSLQHEMSTGINMPANCTCDSCLSQACESDNSDSCTCEVQKRLMRKPVERNTHDYGIHRASVRNNNYVNLIDKLESNYFAMFASTSFRKLEQNAESCDCNKCECLICNVNGKTTEGSRILENLDYKPDELHKHSLKCLPCESEICRDKNGPSITLLHNKTACTCDVCDCLQCADFSKEKSLKNTDKKVKITLTNNICQCDPCECNECQLMMYNSIGESCDCNSSKCEVCNGRKMSLNVKKQWIPLMPGINLKYKYSKENIPINNKSFTSDMPEDANFVSENNINIFRIHDVLMDQRSQKLKISDILCDVHSKETEDRDGSEMYKNSKSNSLIEDEGKPFYREDRSPYSRKVVNKCLKDVMNIDLNDHLDCEELELSEFTSNQWFESSGENKEFNIHRTQPLENGYCVRSTDFQGPSINNINDNSTANYCNDMKLINQNKSGIKIWTHDLVSLVRANIELDSVYHKSKLSSSDIIEKIVEKDNQNSTIDHNQGKIDNNIFESKIDLEKLKHTLHQAKAFSSELMEILKQCEKANKDFKNFTSLKRTYSNVGLHSGKTSTKDLDLTVDKEMANTRNLHNSRVSRQLDAFPVDNVKINIFEKDIKPKQNTYDLPRVNFIKQSTGENSNNKSLKSETYSHATFEDEDTNKYSKLITLDGENKHSIKVSTNRLNSNNDDVHINSETIVSHIKDSLLGLGSKISKKTLINSVIMPDTKEKEDLMIPGKYVSSSTLTVDDQSGITSMLHNQSIKVKEVNGYENDKYRSILKKNTCLFTSPFSSKKPVCFIPTLPLGVKNFLSSVPRQYYNEDYNLSECQNNDHTMSEVQKPITNQQEDCPAKISKHTFIKTPSTIDEFDGDPMKSDFIKSKSSCDFLKVKFLGLRRVSDHTVLVKWQLPHDVTKVRGYELLVDGRAIEKISQPSRCMAVVSCLPHLDKVLITIRTLVSSHQCPYLPSATVIYHPRHR